MNLNISNFPHAHYNEAFRLWYLLYYYPPSLINSDLWYNHISLTEEVWKARTYSGRIHEYQGGEEDAITYFIAPLTELIAHIMEKEERDKAWVIPAPSSIPENHAMYNDAPRGVHKPTNRDNRNSILCEQLVEGRKNLIKLDILKRIIRKPPEENWPGFKHAQSFEINENNISPGEDYRLLILLDDLYVKGGTMMGAETRIKGVFPEARIVRLCLGLTELKDFYPVGNE